MSAQIKKFPVKATAIEEAVMAGEAAQRLAASFVKMRKQLDADASMIEGNEGGQALADAVKRNQSVMKRLAKQIDAKTDALEAQLETKEA